MLVIGHRGAAGLAHENTLEALQAGFRAGADILEFDVRLTSDGVPVLLHDPSTRRTHDEVAYIHRHTLAELKAQFRKQPICTLEEVLQKFFGKVVLNIEIKSRHAGEVVLALVEQRFITQPADWNKVFFSSFHSSELEAIRCRSKKANLALLHTLNPFAFIACHRKLRLTAAGFHRLYVNKLALEIAKRAGIFTYIYTVDRPQAALRFARRGVDGIVTNRPDVILSEIGKQA